jgi:hypothetical protein
MRAKSGSYKPDAGPAECEACPQHAVTEEEASRLITACLCGPGYTGQIEDK